MAGLVPSVLPSSATLIPRRSKKPAFHPTGDSLMRPMRISQSPVRGPCSLRAAGATEFPVGAGGADNFCGEAGQVTMADVLFQPETWRFEKGGGNKEAWLLELG